MFRFVVLAIVMALTAPASAGEFKGRAEPAPVAKPAPAKAIAKRPTPQRRAKAAPKTKKKVVAKREKRPLP